MMIFEKIKQEIMNDPMNESYTKKGIPPLFKASVEARIAIVGQAPGRKVHESSIPWNDQSGNNLRTWLNVTKDQFYNPDLFALLPMGFCYPGKGKSGDLPPFH